MTTLLTVIHIVACVFLILLVLLQSGKGAEISASFAGSSQTVFGSAGGANFFTRLTAIFAGIFMITSIALTITGNQSQKSVFEGNVPIPQSKTPAAPAAPAESSAPAAANSAAPAAKAEAPKAAAPSNAAAPAAPAPEAKKK